MTIVEVNKYDFSNFEFYCQNLENFRTCTKHNSEDIYCIIPSDGKFAIIVNDKNTAKSLVNECNNSNLVEHLETDFQEEVENITPQNIEQKKNDILNRFNRSFKLNVTYIPTEFDFSTINKQVKNTVWSKENIFLLNFYMMEVSREHFNYDWYFRKIYTFNTFYIPEIVGKSGRPKTYYKWLSKNERKYFDFKRVLGL